MNTVLSSAFSVNIILQSNHKGGRETHTGKKLSLAVNVLDSRNIIFITFKTLGGNMFESK